MYFQHIYPRWPDLVKAALTQGPIISYDTLKY